MMQFEIGSKVRCVEPGTYLTIGKIYIVLHPDEHYRVHFFPADPKTATTVISDTGIIHAWDNDRFELIVEIKEIDYFGITKSICG